MENLKNNECKRDSLPNGVEFLKNSSYRYGNTLSCSYSKKGGISAQEAGDLCVGMYYVPGSQHTVPSGASGSRFYCQVYSPVASFGRDSQGVSTEPPGEHIPFL